MQIPIYLTKIKKEVDGDYFEAYIGCYGREDKDKDWSQYSKHFSLKTDNIDEFKTVVLENKEDIKKEIEIEGMGEFLVTNPINIYSEFIFI